MTEEDASLTDFVGVDDVDEAETSESGAADGESETSESGAVDGESETSESGAAEGESEAPGDDPDDGADGTPGWDTADGVGGAGGEAGPPPAPAPATAEWTPGGAACDDCGTDVQRRWRDGAGLVCPDCKEW